MNAKAGKPLLYLPDGPKVYKELYGSGWVAPTKFLEERPDGAKAFCDAIDEALAFIKAPANRATSASVLAADTGVSPEVANLVVEQAYKDFSTTLDKDTLTKTFDTFVDLGIAKAEPRPTYDELVAAPR
ncbi:hypothetical protein [Microbispora sp. CA-102843]|uniref:hypothetical protein n=1 Tax=Microbispora sp. CA-102843 TaxID=3239952 RepID=UPI003D8D968C